MNKRRFVPGLTREFISDYGSVPSDIMSCLIALYHIQNNYDNLIVDPDYNTLDNHVEKLIYRAENSGEDVRKYRLLKELLDEAFTEASGVLDRFEDVRQDLIVDDPEERAGERGENFRPGRGSEVELVPLDLFTGHLDSFREVRWG
jgi:hypothetical protein